MTQCVQIDQIYQEFDEENRAYKEEFKKVYFFYFDYKLFKFVFIADFFICFAIKCSSRNVS